MARPDCRAPNGDRTNYVAPFAHGQEKVKKSRTIAANTRTDYFLSRTSLRSLPSSHFVPARDWRTSRPLHIRPSSLRSK